MRKESKLSRIPSVDEVAIRPSLPFLGMKFEVTAPESQIDEISMKWARFVPPLKKVNQKSLEYKTIPKMRKGIKEVYTKNKFMLSDSDENWVFNWSLSQKILEINVNTKASNAYIRRLGAFAFGVMMYDTGLRPPVKKFFARKVKQDKIPLQGIQKYLKFLKDGAQLGRARASFAWGFMMHLEQVSSKFYGHPLHALVGEVLFDNKAYIVKDDKSYQRFKIDDLAPLAYQYDPDRFDLVYKDRSPQQIADLKTEKVGGVPYEDALDQTGIAPFFNAMKKNIIEAVNDPSHRKHSEVMRGLGISRAEQLDPSKFSLRVSHSNSSMRGYLSWNGRSIANANRTSLSKSDQYNSLCEVEPPFQGLGSGMHMTASQIETAMRTGKKTIRVSAALSGGWKTWNKFGFESNSPVVNIHNTMDTLAYCEKSVDAKLFEMGDVDRQEVMTRLISELVVKYRLRFTADAVSTVAAPALPALPADANEDVKAILIGVIDKSGSYSTAMRDMLRTAGIISESNRGAISTWIANNTVTKQQQQKVHDYFLSGRSSFEDTFRQRWGYPARQGSSSRPQVSNTEVDGALKGMIERWGWFNGQPFSSQMVLQLVASPQFDVVHGYGNLTELMAWMKTAGITERSNVLTNDRLTPKTQFMQDCMEVDGFTDYWDNIGSQPGWGGTMDFSDGKYSLAVLAMDRYRKLKIAKTPALAQNPAFQRARRASILEEFSIDPDLLKKFPNTEDVELDGGISRVDQILMEQSLRDAKIIQKEIKRQMKEQEGEAAVRVASRWLGGE